VLIVDRVTKSYRTPRGELPILNGISLSLEHGAAIAIMGPSGSGKSTLLYILGALEPPSSGIVTLGGKDPFRMGEREQAAFRNQQIGFVFQDHSLLPQCSVLENVLKATNTGRTRFCHRSGSAIVSTIVPRSCPAARNSALPSRAHSSATRRCCCATSRRETSIVPLPRRSQICCCSCTPSETPSW
jgi:ABC-type ATPase involved in cell division